MTAIGNDTSVQDLIALLESDRTHASLQMTGKRRRIILAALRASTDRALPIASGMADRVVAFISERDPFGDSFSAHDLEQIEHRLGSAARLSAVVQDMLGGLAYLRSTDTVPYGFGIDRLEQTGRAALAGTDQPTLTEPPEGGP
jgi:hypothetical protein